MVEKSLQLEDSQPTTVIWPAEVRVAANRQHSLRVLPPAFLLISCISTLFLQEVVDDYTFECEVGGQAQRTKVSIFQSRGDPLVYGKIYCSKEPKAEEDSADLKLIHPP